MNDVYVFIATQNGLISYPNDQTHSYFQYAISKAKNNAQIVLVRKDSLSHYCYVRKIADKQYFGICLRLDCIYKDTEDLFRAFDAAYANLIQEGVLLQMTDVANVIIHETNLSDESVAIAELTDNLLHALAISGKTTLPLPPADFSISIKDCIELSFEDSTNVEIIRAIQKYSNVYIVKTHDEISRITEFKKLIQKLKDEINQLQDIVFKQKDEIADLKKQKNKYKWVLFLLAIIFVGAIVFFNVMQSKNDSIYELQQENAKLKIHVNSLRSDSSTLANALARTKEALSKANCKIENLEDSNKVLANDLSSKEMEISQLNKTISVYGQQISKLTAQLPQTYKTKYDNQYFYNKCKEYNKTECYWPQKGTMVTIYLKEDGYGLTAHGWIPMNRLIKVSP